MCMVSVSDLSSEHVEMVKGWVAEGAQMADVQRRLNDDLGFKATYMDTRCISLDLELNFQVDEEEVQAEEVIEVPQVEEEPDLEGEKPSGGSPITDLRLCKHQLESTSPTDIMQKKWTTTKVTKTFRSYIQTLEPWEQRLLKHIREHHDSYGSSIIHLQMADKIWLVTDGGLNNGDGYFGWVIASNTNILWEGRGYV